MQNVLWMVLELLANLLESFLCVHFLIGSFDGKCRILGSKGVHIIGNVFFTTAVTVLNRIAEYEGVLGLVYAVFLLRSH